MGDRKNIFRDFWFWPAMLAGGFFLMLTLWYGSGVNSAIFSYAAWVWKHYHLPPYVGAWDPSFPGIFFIHQLALELFGAGFFGFRLFDFVVQMSSLCMIFYLSRRLANASIAGFFAALSYGIYYFGLGSLESGEQEGFLLWLLLLTMVVSVGLKERGLLRAFLSGILLGLALTLQPIYGLCGPVFGVWFFRQGLRNRPGRVWVELGVFKFSWLLPALAIIFYYWRLGYPGRLFQAAVSFNWFFLRASDFSVFGAQPQWAMAITVVNYIFMQQPVVMFSALLAVLLAPKTLKDPETRSVYRVLSALIIIGLASYLIPGKYFPHQLTVFFGLLMVLSGAGLAGVGSELKNHDSGVRGGIFAGTFYLAIAGFMLLYINPKSVDFAALYSFGSLDRAHSAGNNFDAYYYRLAKQLKPVLQDKDEVEYFGWQPLLPYLLEKKIPSRFCSVPYLVMRSKDGETDPLQREWINEYSDAVIKARPRFFLISGNVPEWEMYNLKGPGLKQALHENFPELEKFWASNYLFKGRSGEIEVYELKP